MNTPRKNYKINKSGTKIAFWIQAPKKVQLSKNQTEVHKGRTCVHFLYYGRDLCLRAKHFGDHSCIKSMNAAKTTQGEPLYSLLSDTAK